MKHIKRDFIIKNCPAHDSSITEWDCLGSDATECKNGHCMLKTIYDLLLDLEDKSIELSFCEFKQYVDEVYLDAMYNLFDIEEVK